CLPERYLGGIIRNVEQRDFLEQMGRNLLELRLEVSDRQLDALRARAADIEAVATGAVQRTEEYVLQALQSDSTLAFRFWSRRALDAIGGIAWAEVRAVCTHLRRMIGASFRLDFKRRECFLAELMAAAVPVAG
ncbi:MAG TPA: hypothetical protein PLM08_17530, partial [Polyangiaceae bacterium]|nr:hypothetical protein [Polyangiaceae bacterium]